MQMRIMWKVQMKFLKKLESGEIHISPGSRYGTRNGRPNAVVAKQKTFQLSEIGEGISWIEGIK